MDIEITRKTTLDEIRTIFENIATNQISILSVSCDGATEAQLEAIAFELAENIAKKIEAELKYPGEIRVTVIRENKVVEIAR